MQGLVVSGIRPRFRGLSQSQGQVTHVLLTRSPLEYPRKGLSARLACVKHAASVRPEPGSNSPINALKRNLVLKKTRYLKTFIGTGLLYTLLSSQRTDAHRFGPLGRPQGLFSQSYPGRFRSPSGGPLRPERWSSAQKRSLGNSPSLPGGSSAVERRRHRGDSQRLSYGSPPPESSWVPDLPTYTVHCGRFEAGSQVEQGFPGLQRVPTGRWEPPFRHPL